MWLLSSYSTLTKTKNLIGQKKALGYHFKWLFDAHLVYPDVQIKHLNIAQNDHETFVGVAKSF